MFRILGIYNFDNRLKIHTTPVEYDLIKDQLQEIDEKLNNAEHLLNWNSDGKKNS